MTTPYFWSLPPLPPANEPPDWGRLPIDECGEPLVPIEQTERLRVRALYHEMNLPGAEKTLLVRAGVHDRLQQAARSLPDGVALVVFDGYRPLPVQQALYDEFTREAKQNRPDLQGDALKAYVGQFVALPTSNPLRPPPHRTGGAVDVYLVWAANGLHVPMGTLPDEVSHATATRFYEEGDDWEALRQNRRLLFWTMTNAGFQNYMGEWWHYDWGNQRWANLSGPNQSAVYGIPREGV